MMSTFSRVSGNPDDPMGDDDDDDPTTSTSSFQNLPVNTSISSNPSDSLASTVTNGIADESVAAATTVAATASNGKVNCTELNLTLRSMQACCLYALCS